MYRALHPLGMTRAPVAEACNCPLAFSLINYYLPYDRLSDRQTLYGRPAELTSWRILRAYTLLHGQLDRTGCIQTLISVSGAAAKVLWTLGRPGGEKPVGAFLASAPLRCKSSRRSVPAEDRRRFDLHVGLRGAAELVKGSASQRVSSGGAIRTRSLAQVRPPTDSLVCRRRQASTSDVQGHLKTQTCVDLRAQPGCAGGQNACNKALLPTGTAWGALPRMHVRSSDLRSPYVSSYSLGRLSDSILAAQRAGPSPPSPSPQFFVCEPACCQGACAICAFWPCSPHSLMTHSKVYTTHHGMQKHS